MVFSYRVRLYGRVQGVGFRYTCQRQAQSLNVNGWVRNRSDGSVEALVQGEEEATEKMLAWLKHGPNSAKVDICDIEDCTGKSEDKGFTIQATA